MQRRIEACLVTILLGAFAAACAHTPLKGRVRDIPSGEVGDMRARLAEVLVAQRDYDAALPYLEQLIATYPRRARLHLLRGVVLREKGVYPMAEQELRLALTLGGVEAAAHAGLGVLLAKTGRLAEAERAHRRAIALAPAHAGYRNDLGFCLLLRRKFSEARRELQEALRLDPSLRRAFNNLGLAHGLAGDEDGALRAFRQGGSRATAMTNMGFVAEVRGRPGVARRYYQRALRVHGGFAPARHNLRVLMPGTAASDDDEDRPQAPASAPDAASDAVPEAEEVE